MANIYDLHIRGLFMHVCYAIIAPFDRWEIAIGQQRRRRSHIHSPLEPYQYCELSESPRHIRLLRLRRRSFFSSPSCELIQVPLDKAPPFEAISYTLGDRAPNIPVEVGGRQMLVTSTVDELLFYRRSIFTSALFRTDSICINQEDNDEKNNQLPTMADIYRRVSRVVVWLGASESRKDTYIVRKMIRVLYYPEYFKSTNALFPHLFKNEDEPYIAIGMLLSHLWFARVWIIQEVTIGKEVHVIYHGTCTEWNLLADAIKHLGTDSEFSRQRQYYNSPKVTSTNTYDQKLGRSATMNTIHQVRLAQLGSITPIRSSMETGNLSSLSVILPMTSVFKSTNPRDKVFAVLGIAKDSHQPPFKPDYNEDVEKVFLKTTAFVLSSKSRLIILSFAGRGYESYSRTPRSVFMDKLL